jgi:glycosyltransferase involved in cell wall biosynthesis
MMRIALVAPLVSPIAPPFLGGAQVLVRDLAAGLAARGHAVTLYAADGSAVAGVRTVPLGIDPAALAAVRVDQTRNAEAVPAELGPVFFAQAHHFLRVFRHLADHAADYDLVHAHAYDWPAFAFAGLLSLPVLHTLHLPAGDRGMVAVLRTVAPGADRPAGAPRNTRLAAVSRACAASYAPDVAVGTVLYNGVDLDAIPFGAIPSADPYLLFAGRIAPEKGVVDALAIARRAGVRLLLAGDVYDPAYARDVVGPPLAELQAAGRAAALGPLPRARVWELMAGALAVLVPSHWAEPFGLVPCEAQAAGAPVVGYAVGALPEVVEHGETGWLVPPGDVEGAAAAVARAAALSRAACRARVAQRFGLAAMLDAHERVYGELVAGTLA